MKIYDVPCSEAVKAICLCKCSSILCKKEDEVEEEDNYQEAYAVQRVHQKRQENKEKKREEDEWEYYDEEEPKEEEIHRAIGKAKNDNFFDEINSDTTRDQSSVRSKQKKGPFTGQQPLMPAPYPMPIYQGIPMDQNFHQSAWVGGQVAMIPPQGFMAPVPGLGYPSLQAPGGLIVQQEQPRPQIISKAKSKNPKSQ